MAQKIHPKGFRLGITKNYSTRWFTKNSQEYSQNIYQDTCIRQYLAQIYPNVIDIIIQRYSAHKSALSTVEEECQVRIVLLPIENLSIFSPYARKILKMKSSSKIKKKIQIQSQDMEAVKAGLLKSLPFNENVKLSIEFDQTKDSAQAVALEIQNALFVAQKKKNLKFQPILKLFKRNLMKQKSIRGFRIQLSGRAAGSLMASREYVLHGQMPRQTIRIPLDYEAFDFPTKIGLVGVKIWIYHETN